MIPNFLIQNESLDKFEELFSNKNYSALMEYSKSKLEDNALDCKALYWYLTSLAYQGLYEEAVERGGEIS